MSKHTCDSRSSFRLQFFETKAGTNGNRLRHWFDLLSRSLVSLAIVVMVLMIARGVDSNRSFGEAAVTATEINQAQPQLSDIGAIVDGHWQFAGLPWSVKIKQVAEDEAAQILESTLPDAAQQFSRGDSIQVFDILQALRAETTESGSYAVHRIYSESFRVVAFAPSLHPKSIFLVRAMQLLESGKWNLIEVQLTTEPQMRSTDSEHLLPTAPANRRLATRSNSNGKLVAELIDRGAPVAKLKQMWRAEGWQVGEPQGTLNAIAPPMDAVNSPLSPVADVSLQSEGKNEILICTQGNSTVAAIFQNVVNGDSSTLLLLRLEK